ncbi:sodium channel subunit beta-1-like [Meleagris gallopavo]|uniref:sodium channel subunit beta-1-like n=1 Tax=Meleagris gallopavo TaxID=9103 RepID=UPI0012AB6883|nr:sodium channel subunit beta-1-like [Meleagris gallopavo]
MGLYVFLWVPVGFYGSLRVPLGSLCVPLCPAPRSGLSIPPQILHYTPEEGAWVAPGPFQGVLSWNGSHGTRDIQDLSVRLSAVGRPHAGLYVCRLRRNLTFEGYTYSLARNKSVKLAVVESGTVPLRELGGEGGRYCAFKRVVLCL